jgi:hypothetical protein
MSEIIKWDAQRAMAAALELVMILVPVLVKAVVIMAKTKC